MGKMAERTVGFRHKIYHCVGTVLAPKLHSVTDLSFIAATPRPFTLFLKSQAKENLVGIEIGFGLGFNAASLLQELDIKTLYCVDPCIGKAYIDGTVITKFVNKKNLLSEITITGKAVFITKRSQDAHSLFQNESVDFVYIDGVHEYMAVLSDLTNYYSKIKRGAFIAGHDFTYRSDVVQVVGDFAVEKNLPYQVCFPDFWFRKP